MKLPRPYVPYSVRVEVAARQAFAAGIVVPEEQSHTRQLSALLFALFGNGRVHLDHDPPLMLRAKRMTDGEMEYLPDANDPEFLIYRNASDHKIKTLIRGDGALRSDFAQRRYLKRLEKNRRPTKKKFKPRPAKQIRRAK